MIIAMITIITIIILTNITSITTMTIAATITITIASAITITVTITITITMTITITITIPITITILKAPLEYSRPCCELSALLYGSYVQLKVAGSLTLSASFPQAWKELRQRQAL